MTLIMTFEHIASLALPTLLSLRYNARRYEAGAKINVTRKVFRVLSNKKYHPV